MADWVNIVTGQTGAGGPTPPPFTNQQITSLFQQMMWAMLAQRTPDGTEEVMVSDGFNLKQEHASDIAAWNLQTYPGFTQIGAGAVARTVQAELQDCFNAKQFGVKGDGITDDTIALNLAGLRAKVAGKALWLPAGVYTHSGLVTFDSIAVFGDGDLTILKSTDTTTPSPQHAIVLQGANVSLRNVQTATTWLGARQLNNQGSAILVQPGTTSFNIENVYVTGAATAGIMLYGSTFGTVSKNRVTGTLADGITHINGCLHCKIVDNTVWATGDDCISIVSYVGQALCHAIEVNGNIVKSGAKRGITVAGGEFVNIVANVVDSMTLAGILAYADTGNGTQGANHINITGNTVNACGSTSPYYGAISVYGSATFSSGNILISSNEIFNSVVDAIQLGNNAANYVNKVKVSNNLIDSVSNGKNGIFPTGVSNLSIVDNHIYNAGQGVFNGGGGSGFIEIAGNNFSALNPTNVNFYDAIGLGSGGYTSITVVGNTLDAPTNPLRRFLTAATDNVVCSDNNTYGYNISIGSTVPISGIISQSVPGQIVSTAVGGGPISAFLAQSTNPNIGVGNIAAGADYKFWHFTCNNTGRFSMATVNDANSQTVPFLQANRAGVTITSVALPNGRTMIGASTDDGVNQLQVTGGFIAAKTVGAGLKVAEGANAKQGVATLVSGTVTVPNTSVTATSRIYLTAQDNNSTGALRVSARTVGTSFTITSNNAADVGVVAYEIFEPA